jgi:nucleotide-binding universal stress UspA family protein
MYKHILIPTDGTETAAKAIAAGIELARESGAKVTLFTAVPEYQIPGQAEIMSRRFTTPDEHERRSRDIAQAILGNVAEQARSAGVEADTDYVQSDFPYRAIIDAAEGHGCDLIVMGSHGRHGFAEFWHGSQTHDVLTHSTIPTLVYR